MTPVSLTAEPTPLFSAAAPLQTTAAAPTSAADASGATCDLTAALQTALQSSPQVLAQLARMPRQIRSVANAIMVWDGHWSTIANTGSPPMADPLHQTIIGLVRSMSPACKAQPVVGPRLLYVTDPQGATIVAVGSGTWRWADLLEVSQALQ
jgi:hypothetical protein